MPREKAMKGFQLFRVLIYPMSIVRYYLNAQTVPWLRYAWGFIRLRIPLERSAGSTAW